MKKLLYGTTALATAGLVIGAASQAQAQTSPHTIDRLQLRVGGYHQQWVIYNGSTNVRSGGSPTGNHPFDLQVVDEKHNSEVCFVGEIKLDNQITFGVNVQLEANTSADQIDESFMFASMEDYGRIELGDTNSAAYKLQVVAPDGGITHNQGDLTAIPQQGLVGPLPASFASANTFIDGTFLRPNDNDSGKISYFTPRIGGFQAGVSFIPRGSTAGGDDNNSISSINGDKGIAGTGDGAGWNNGWAAGVNFKDQFGDIGVQASLGVQGADVGSNIGDNNLLAGAAGLQLSFGGISVGGSIGKMTGDRTGAGGATATKYDSTGYDAGVAYNFGPYKVGITYQKGEASGIQGNGSKNFADYIVLSGSYQVGPGVRLVGGVYGFDLDGENGSATATSVYKSTGIGAATGFKLSF
jgi:predicted porin